MRGMWMSGVCGDLFRLGRLAKAAGESWVPEVCFMCCRGDNVFVLLMRYRMTGVWMRLCAMLMRHGVIAVWMRLCASNVCVGTRTVRFQVEC